jgi:hypothetical protein
MEQPDRPVKPNQEIHVAVGPGFVANDRTEQSKRTNA